LEKKGVQRKGRGGLERKKSGKREKKYTFSKGICEKL